MIRWPWISTAIAVLLGISPLGQEFLHNAFVSGEQLSRNIAQPIVFMAVLILAVLGALELWIGSLVRRRRRASRGASALD
jgi:hypothetical protein